MPFLQRLDIPKVQRVLLLGLIAFSVLWRGGKSIDATWILVGVVSLLVLLDVFHRRKVERVELKVESVPFRLWLLVIAYITWTVLSYVNSQTANYGLDEVFRTTSLGLLFLWTIRHSELFTLNSSLIPKFLTHLTLLACIIGLLVYILQPVDRFVGTFFDYRFHTDYWPNAWGEFLLLVWPVVAYFCMGRQVERGKLRVESVLLGFVLGCLFLSYSRGSIIAFTGQIFLLAVSVFLAHKKRSASSPLSTLHSPLLLVLLSTIITFFGANLLRANIYDVQSVSEKVTFTAAEGTSSASERSQFWSHATTLSKQEPLFGYGPYSFRFVQTPLQEGVLATSDHPHNVFLKLAAERGIVSALLFFLIIVLVASSLLYFFTSSHFDASHKENHLLLAMFVGIAGLLAHNLIDYNLQFTGIAILFWIFLACIYSATCKDKETKNQKPKTKNISVIIEVLMATILLCTAFYEGLFLVTSSLGRHAQARGDSVAALQWFDRSVRENFSRDLHLSRAQILQEQGKYDAAIDALDAYLGLNEHDFRAWKRRGDILSLQKQFSDAEMAYTTAYLYGRYNDIGIMESTVDLLIRSGKRNEVRERKEEFDALLTAYANAITFNVHYISLSPNVESFIRLAERFATFDYRDAPKYQVFAAKADHHATYERERLKSRAPGFLW